MKSNIIEDLKTSRKRRVPRRVFHQKAGILLHGRHHYGFTHQLGEGGLSLEANLDLHTDQKLLINFHLPGQGLVIVRGIVRYKTKEAASKNGFSFGIQFENMDFDLKRQIRNFVASQKKSIVQEYDVHVPSNGST